MTIPNDSLKNVLKLCACRVGGSTWCHSVDAGYLGGLNDGCFTLPDNQHAHECNVILICRNSPRSHSNLSLNPNISEMTFTTPHSTTTSYLPTSNQTISRESLHTPIQTESYSPRYTIHSEFCKCTSKNVCYSLGINQLIRASDSSLSQSRDHLYNTASHYNATQADGDVLSGGRGGT